MSINFNELSALFKSDPEAFERLRKREIEKAIASSSAKSQQRLRGLQFQIDAKRAICKDKPYRSCIEISKMMHAKFNELNGELSVFRRSHQSAKQPAQQSSQSRSANATVLAFKREC